MFGKEFAEIYGGFQNDEDEDLEAAFVPDDELYAACRTNGVRATKRQMEALHEALVRIVKEIAPCTVRQVFYQATVRSVVDKTEAGYDRVQRALVVLRRNGRIGYRQITDNTRWQIKPTTYTGLQDALQETARLYRAILQHLPADQLDTLRVAEQSEREMLKVFAREVIR
jgi:hypothetical protein